MPKDLICHARLNPPEGHEARDAKDACERSAEQQGLDLFGKVKGIKYRKGGRAKRQLLAGRV